MSSRTTMRAALIGLVLTAPLALAGCTSTAVDHPASSGAYGKLPAFLPKAAIHPDSTLTGSAAHPALTTEGDAVRVTLAKGSVLMTVAGPEVPGEGLPYQTSATTCTWTVTVSKATRPTVIRASDFTTIDHLGAVYHPVFVAGQPLPPKTLLPGKSTTFELRAVMQVGEGLMRWAPAGGPVLASWDFEVEND